jgi:hypothetical protein
MVVAVGEDLADLARIRQAPALGHAQEQPRQPVGEVAADQEEVVVLELVEQLLRRQVLRLQRADEFQHVLVRDHVGRRGREFPEQVIDDGALQFGALGRQVGDPVGRVGHDLRQRGLAAEALEVDRLLQQRVEGGGDEHVEIGDPGQLAQRRGRRQRQLAHDGAQPRVDFLAAAPLAEVPAHHVVEGERLRQFRNVNGQARREFFRQQLEQQARALLRVDPQQLRADDRDDAALLDEIEQVVPRVLVKVLQFG